VLPNHQHTLKMGTKFVLDTSENLHILMRLSARENFISYNVLLGHVLFKCFEFLSENKVIIYNCLKLSILIQLCH
jgi:hypothetical protein